MFKAYRCNRCSKGFDTEPAANMHIRDKHHGKGLVRKGERVQRQEPPDEESMAERAIQAQIDIACGLPTDDAWLLP